MSTPAPTSPCDLVMRGGITSGVIYPQVVFALKDRYWFRGIGGASVGVVAAAGAAAAEHGRHSGGFDRLDRLSKELAKPGRLLRLFQPTQATRPAFDLALAAVSYKGTVPGFLFRHLALRPALAVALLVLVLAGVFAAVVATTTEVRTEFWVRTAMVTVALALLAVMALTPLLVYQRAVRMVRAVAANDLGLCTGMTEGRAGGTPALTEFLHQQFAALAGLDQDAVLTFGHLKRNDGGRRPIELRLMTADLSTQLPVVFPLAAGQQYLFRKAEFDRLFPPAVVAHLTSHPPAKAPGRPPEGFHFLPDPDDLPVLVPVRISLGHPVLFTGVPLYGLSAAYPSGAAITTDHLQRHLFSDGGIVSNFPIHLFDRWLPVAPTFGINLADVEGDDPPAANSAAAPPVTEKSLARSGPAGVADAHPRTSRVFLPRADEVPAVGWRGVATWGELAAAIFYTAKNHRDTAQAQLPSYRERVVTVRLTGDEGGLNLNMPPEVVERLQGYGAEAGRVLADTFDFRQHQWTRMRVVLCRLEQQLRSLRADFARPPYDALFVDGRDGERMPFPLEAEQRESIRSALADLWKAVDALLNAHPAPPGGPLDVSPPESLPALRFVPPEGL